MSATWWTPLYRFVHEPRVRTRPEGEDQTGRERTRSRSTAPLVVVGVAVGRLCFAVDGRRVSVWMLPLGVALIGLVTFDGAITILWTTKAGGPLTTAIGRCWWRVTRRLANDPASRLLTSAGPLILAATIVVWLLLLWTGWTLVFAADPSAVVSSETRVPAGFLERAYFAGFAIFTLGMGDYAPVGAPWQLLTVIATVGGLAATTGAITYIIPVVTAAIQSSQQASSINALGGRAHCIVLNAYDNGSVRYLEPVLIQLTDGLLLTAQRHLAFPILDFFHPSTPQTDLRAQLTVLDDALMLVQHGLDEQLVVLPHPAAIDGARTAISQLVDRAQTNVDAAPLPLDLAPLRGSIPTVDDATFQRRMSGFHDHRRRVARYGAESGWTGEDHA